MLRWLHGEPFCYSTPARSELVRPNSTLLQLRYLKVVQRMKQILEENNLTVVSSLHFSRLLHPSHSRLLLCQMATVARYVCSYGASPCRSMFEACQG